MGTQAGDDLMSTKVTAPVSLAAWSAAARRPAHHERVLLETERRPGRSQLRPFGGSSSEVSCHYWFENGVLDAGMAGK